MTYIEKIKNYKSVQRKLQDNKSYNMKLHNKKHDISLISEASRVLVLSPHQDDEIIGCGGALLYHRNSGHNIDCCYLTDGARGKVAAGLTEETAGIRRLEACRVNEKLNSDRVIFWNNRDLELEVSVDNIEKMKSLLIECQPLLIYAPSPFERHPDHYKTFGILLRAVQALCEDITDKSQFCERCYVHLYSVWDICFFNYTLDISDLWKDKLELLSLYKSQEIFGITELTSCADRYFALQTPFGRAGYCENYIRLPLKRICELLENEVI